MKHSYFQPVCMLAISLLAFLGCNPGVAVDKPELEIWRFAIEESEGSVQHEYALQFKKLIEQRTAGKVEVIIYPYGTLGTSTHITEQLNMGVIELAMASPGSLGKFIPQLQVFLLHFVLPKEDRAIQEILGDSELMALIDQWYAPKDLKLLSIFSEGEMVWTMKKEIRRPEDFRGVKMRVMTSPILLAAYGAYGASPTPMPYSEVYSGLQLNMIDGQVNPIFAIERQKFHEVTSWLIFPHHASFITTCAANLAFFESLPTSRRKLVTEVIKELDDYIFEVQTHFQTERLKDILRDKLHQRSEYTVCGDLGPFIASLSDSERRELIEDNDLLRIETGLSADEREAFRRSSQGVRDEFLEIGGPDADKLLDRLLNELSSADADSNQTLARP